MDEHSPDPMLTTPVPPSSQEIGAILDLIADSARVLHTPYGGERSGSVGGGDIDCIVSQLDAMWPLRLGNGWRLCQYIRYDITGWSWTLQRGQQFALIDTLDDPDGLGKYGFPTRHLDWAQRTDDGVDAAYLTAKRLKKRMLDPDSWAQIAQLAAGAPKEFRNAMAPTFGKRIATRLEAVVFSGDEPTPQLARAARAAQFVRRIRTPRRALQVTVRTLARGLERVIRPTGFYVVITGPDGTGKSLAAESLVASLRPFFRRAKHLHWRPGILPRPGEILGKPERDSTRPHDTTPRAKPLSLIFLLYYWLDFLLGAILLILPLRIHTGLVLFERGWWDLAVDPLRYRLSVPSWLITLLGWLLPRPDLILVLEGDPATLRERKKELSLEEIRRQTQSWRELAAKLRSVIYIDSNAPAQEVSDRARQAILDRVEERALARLDCGWVGFPRRSNPRWILPRGPRRVATRSIRLYQPVTWKGRLGWEIAVRIARLGFFRVLPRIGTLPTAPLRKLAPFLERGDRIALSRSNHPGRSAAMLVANDADHDRIAKVLWSGESDSLSREARALERWGSSLAPPLSAPTLLASTDNAIVLRAAQWRPRSAPWRLPRDIAFALGVLYRRGGGNSAGGPAHGDTAPWNLLRLNDSWMLIDWEHAREAAPPFFDFWHYVVQGHALLGRPKRDSLLEALTGGGEIGDAMVAYADGAQLSVELGNSSFKTYLNLTLEELDPETEDGLAGVQARESLLGAIRLFD